MGESQIVLDVAQHLPLQRAAFCFPCAVPELYISLDVVLGSCSWKESIVESGELEQIPLGLLRNDYLSSPPMRPADVSAACGKNPMNTHKAYKAKASLRQAAVREHLP